MSSVLLLLLVLGWIGFLVPLLAHRSGPTTEIRSADSFASAMRVLARRSAPAGTRPLVVPARPNGAGAVLSGAGRRGTSVRRVTQLRRRRRTLGVLLALVTVGAGGLAAGLVWALPLLLIALATLVACLVHLRRSAAAAQQRLIVRRRAARSAAIARAERAAREASLVRAHRMARPAYDDQVARVSVYAETIDVELPVTGTDGSWTPAPVPRPTYATAPAAAQVRMQHVVDLTRPGAWSAAAGHRPEPWEDEPEGPGEELLRRRAVGS